MSDPDRLDVIYKRVFDLIVSNLAEAELIELHEVMNGDPHDELFEMIGNEVRRHRPDLFQGERDNE